MSQRKGMEKKLHDLVYDSVTISEFENRWVKMMEEYNANGNDHLKGPYELKEMWVPVYFNQILCPFIHSTSRSESTNSHFKDFVMPKDTIEKFMQQYRIIQESSVSKEDENRFTSIGKEPTYCTMQVIERQAAKIYNRKIFALLQAELYHSSGFSVKELIKDHKYIVIKNYNYHNPEFTRESFSIEADTVNKVFRCECTKFERDWLLCCHVLRLFTQIDINELPDTCINKRWTKEYREQELEKHKQKMIAKTGNDKNKKAARYAMIMNRVLAICDEVCNDGEESKEFIEDLQKIHCKFMKKR
uniref:Protein FAR1-RELATED SEQUENCE n=1 Tax=Arundo donax TaxID=35708 RepID=A0A0A9BVY5_ARUDO